jgi:hypothetical protein
MHCRRFVLRPVTRRDMLLRCANGFGALALAALLREPAFGAVLGEAKDATGPRQGPFHSRSGHFPAKARSVIFLYMDGGPSQVDTFDPKPRLWDRATGNEIQGFFAHEGFVCGLAFSPDDR